MQTILYSIKNYLYRLDQARRGTYLDKQRRKFKYFLKDKLEKRLIKTKTLIVRGGVWLISHSPFLKNEFKILFKDFKDYYALKQTLVLNLHSTYFIKNLNTIKEWLYSKEFKQNYQDKNHPYPSLLNPEKIDYESIPAELAWKMNLPLPPYYSFLLMRGHGSGGGAMISFLKNCNVEVHSKQHFPNIVYSYFYKNLLNHSMQYNVLIFAVFRQLLTSYIQNGRRDKLFLLVDKKVPILFQVRDPIGQIKHVFGRKWRLMDKTWQTIFYLNDEDFLQNIPIIQKIIQKDFCKRTYNILEFKRQVFIQNSLANAFKHSGEITYLDMSEISKEKAFDTMTKLSQKFGFDSPKEEDRHFFETKKTSGRAIFQILPLTLLARAKDIGAGNEEVKIEISVPEENTTQLDLTKEIIDFIPLQDFAFYITQEDYEILKNNDKLFEATKNYLKDFAYKLDERIKLEESLMLNEKDVLEYLRNNKQARLDLKSILDEELAHVEAHRPDIVASWKYYQEFENMCEELDGK